MRLAIFLSGGGTKLSFLLSSCLVFMQRFGIYVTAYGGSSAGAITAFAAAIGKSSEMRKYGLNLKPKDFTNFNPNSKIGKIRTYFNFASKGYMFRLDNLEKTLKKIVDEGDFIKWKRNDYASDCFVCTVDPNEPEVKLVNLKDLSYEEAINQVVASSSIMPINPAINTDKGNRIDGGHWHHNPAPLYAKYFKDQFDKIITIYSRPKINVKDSNSEDGDPLKYTYDHKKGFDNLMRAIEIQNLRGSIADEKELDEIVGKNKVVKVFAPSKLTSSMHSTGNYQNQKLFNFGELQAQKALDLLKKGR